MAESSHGSDGFQGIDGFSMDDATMADAATDDRATEVLTSIDEKLSVLEGRHRSASKRLLALEEKMFDLKKTVAELQSENVGLRGRINILESSQRAPSPPMSVPISTPPPPPPPPGLHAPAPAAGFNSCNVNFGEQATSSRSASPSGESSALQAQGHQVPGCPCKKAWRLSSKSSPSWNKNIDWAICAQAEDEHYLTKFVQKMQSGNLCGFSKIQSAKICDIYHDELEALMLAPPPNDWKPLFGYVKAYSKAVFGCSKCRGFDMMDLDETLKGSWNRPSVMGETIRFKNWMEHTLGVNLHSDQTVFQ